MHHLPNLEDIDAENLFTAGLRIDTQAEEQNLKPVGAGKTSTLVYGSYKITHGFPQNTRTVPF
jgi:hypothetical protein